MSDFIFVVPVFDVEDGDEEEELADADAGDDWALN